MTGIVACIVIATKFLSGAWLSVLAMVTLLMLLFVIRRHYISAARQLGRRLGGRGGQYFQVSSPAVAPIVIVLVEEITRASLQAIAYLRRISLDTTALFLTHDRASGDAFRDEWEERVPDVPLVVLESASRLYVESALAYLDALENTESRGPITVVLPEILPSESWQQMLHNGLARSLRKALTKRQNIAIASVPFELRDQPEPRISPRN